MNIRYTDLNSASIQASNTDGDHDFVVRRRTPTWQILSMLFICAFFGAVFFSSIFTNPTMYGIFLFMLFSTVGAYVIVLIQRGRDLVLATEFQNALFASALGFSNRFCLIIKQDGTITYLDRSFQELFPNFMREQRRAIDVFLEQGKVNHDQRRLIFAAIQRGTFDKVIFEMVDSKGMQHKIVMSIEPIMRPKGFILLRGRDFVEKRTPAQQALANVAAAQNSTPSFSKSNISFFSTVMDSMNLGFYITNPTGTLTYTNHLLESWLGFDDGEISSGNLSLSNIIHGQGEGANVIALKHFEGEVNLQRKVGGAVRAFINQKSIRDDRGDLIGHAAIVHYLGLPEVDNKKKGW
jgi:PAS domain-containing protein